MIRTLLSGLVLGLFLSSCEEPDIVTSDVLPGTDQPGVYFSDTSTVFSYTVEEDSIFGSIKQSPMFLGSINDASIGQTYASFYMQLRLNSTPPVFPNNTPDSIVLSFGYRSQYGDSTALHHISVYELNESMNADSNYYTNRDFALKTPGVPIGSTTLLPDLYDTLPQLRIRLNDNVASDFFQRYNLFPGDFSVNENFQNYFRGMYIKDSVDFTGGGDVQGNLLALEPGSTYNTVTIYYKDTAGVNQSYSFLMNQSAARSNRITHNYVMGLFTDTIQPASLFAGTVSGVKTKLTFPYLMNISKARPVSINKAELVINVKTGSSLVVKKHPKLYIYAISDIGNNSFIQDFVDPVNYINGGLSGETYRFVISRHVQEILNGTKKNNGLYITDFLLYMIETNAQRTIFNGGADVKLNLTYTIQNN